MQKTKEIKDYYDNLHEKKEGFLREEMDYKIFLKYLKVTKNSDITLLDIACGTGLLLKNAEKLRLKTFGLDISKKALSIARRTTLSSCYVVSTGENICFKNNKFDYVCCLGSLEHFLDISKGIAEMKRVTKKNSKFCIVVPNIKHYRLDAKSKWGIKKIEGTKQQEMQEELHSYNEWVEIFESNGLTVLRVYRDLFFVKKKNPFKNILFYLWLRFLPLKYSYQFIFVCIVT